MQCIVFIYLSSFNTLFSHVVLFLISSQLLHWAYP